MKREVRMAAGALVFAWATAWAQAGGRVGFSYSTKPHPHVEITNNYSSPITALLYVTLEPKPGGRGGGREVGRFDTGVNWPHDRPLAPRRSLSLPVGHFVGVDPATLHPQLAAAVFADGTAVGSPQWVAQIREGWQGLYDEIGKVEAALTNGVKSGLDKDALVTSLRAMEGALYAQGEPRLEETAMALVIDRAIINLNRAPEDGVIGDPQKTVPVLLTDFNEWRGVLGPLLAPPERPTGETSSPPTGSDSLHTRVRRVLLFDAHQAGVW